MDAARGDPGCDPGLVGASSIPGRPRVTCLLPLPADCFGTQPLDVAAALLVRLIREFRPHVMTTYDENGGYPYPDHIQTHKVSMAAFEAAGDPDRYPDAGPVWQPLKLYYDVTFSKAAAGHAARRSARARRLESLYTANGWTAGRTAPSPQRHHPGALAAITSRCGTARRSRTPPRSTRTGSSSRSAMHLQQELWPWEEFELARSLVDTELPEDDLFAGIREHSCEVGIA